MTDKERAGPVATGLGPDPQSYLAGGSRSENTAPLRDTQDAGRAAWAVRIESAWRGAVDGVLATGRLLAEAKAALAHGAFAAMIESDLPFKRSTAFRLMAIAADERLANGAHVQHLPPHWGTLYELTNLSDEQFADKLKSGEIHPDMRRRDVARENRLIAKRRDEERVLGLEPAPGKSRTLVFDPPYDFDWLSEAFAATPGFAAMTHEQMLALAPLVKAWAEDNSHMYLWTPNNFSGRAHELLESWGFAHKTTLTWKKPRMGLGHYFRNQTEHVLFGVRGELPTRSDSIGTIFEGPLGAHSEKPEAFYEIVRAASYPPYGEAFQRTPRPDFVNLYREKKPAP
jgi:N6-adenosine-specific RNA methylase IME4